MTGKLAIRKGDILLVVDIQNDFCPGGALAVPDGDEVVPLINHVASRFEHVVLTQDWHPADHQSFASAHPGMKPYQSIEARVWPANPLAGSLRAGDAWRGIPPGSAYPAC